MRATCLLKCLMKEGPGPSVPFSVAASLLQSRTRGRGERGSSTPGARLLHCRRSRLLHSSSRGRGGHGSSTAGGRGERGSSTAVFPAPKLRLRPPSPARRPPSPPRSEVAGRRLRWSSRVGTTFTLEDNKHRQPCSAPPTVSAHPLIPSYPRRFHHIGLHDLAFESSIPFSSVCIATVALPSRSIDYSILYIWMDCPYASAH
jgi:hypothetical protein